MGISTWPSPWDPEGQDHRPHAAGWAQPDSASVRVDLMMLVVPFRSSLSSACGFLCPEVPAVDPPREISAQWVQLAQLFKESVPATVISVIEHRLIS